MNIWKVLEINETKDKDAIINAYREKLVKVNPEEDQKGFMELRQAYEKALKLAEKADDNNENQEKSEKFPDTPIGNWLSRINEAYNDIVKRRDIDVWKKLLEDDVCFSLETKTEARNELLRYLMDHNYLPHEVWIIIDEKFMIQEYRDELYEIFPVSYINRGVIDNILYEDYIRLDLLESRGGTDYDSYLKLCYDLYFNVNSDNLDEVENILDELKNLKIYHPYEDMFYASYLIRKGEYEEAEGIMQPIWEKYPDNIEMLRTKGVLFSCNKLYDKAKETYEIILQKKPKYYNVLIDIGNVCFELGEYDTAKEYFDKVSDIHRTEYINERYMDCVKELEKVYEKKCEEEPDNSEYILEYARAKYQQGKFEESLKLLEKIHPDNDNYIEYFHLMGCNYMYSKDYEKGYEYLIKWISETEKLTDDGTQKTRKAIRRKSRAYQCMAQNMIGQKKYDLAEEYLNKALETGEHTTEFREDIARLYMIQKRYEDTINACDKVFEYDSASLLGHAIRADALKELRYYRDAISEYDLCIKYEHYNLMNYIKKIEVLFLVEEYDEIKEIIKYLEDNGVKDAIVNKWKAVMEGKTGDYKKALEMLGKLIEENGLCDNDYDKHFMAELDFEVARISLNNEHNAEKAMTYLDKALELEPLLPEALNYKGFILYKEGEYDKAIEVYNKLIDVKPRHFGAFGILGEIYEEKRKYEKAIECYTKQIDIAPNAYVYMSRGYCYSLKEQFEKARADYRKSIELNPDDYNTYRNMGNTYTYEEEEEKAVQLLEKAYNTEGGKEEVWCYKDYSLALLRMGNVEKAIEILKEGMERTDSTELLLKLSRAYCMAGQYDMAEKLYYENPEKKINNRIVELCECLCLMERGDEALTIINNFMNNGIKDSNEYTDLTHLKILEMCIKMKDKAYSSFKSDMKCAIKYYLKEDMGNPRKLIIMRYLYELRKYPADRIKPNSKIMKEMLEKYNDSCTKNESKYEENDRSYSWLMVDKAVIALEKGEFENALDYIDSALNNRKCFSCDFCKCVDGMFVKAVILEVMGKLDEAFEFYEMAAKYDKTDAVYKCEYDRVRKIINSK